MFKLESRCQDGAWGRWEHEIPGYCSSHPPSTVRIFLVQGNPGSPNFQQMSWGTLKLTCLHSLSKAPQPWKPTASRFPSPEYRTSQPRHHCQSSQSCLGSRFHLKPRVIPVANRSNLNITPQPETATRMHNKEFETEKKKVTPSVSTTPDPHGSRVSIFWRSLSPPWPPSEYAPQLGLSDPQEVG